MFRAIVSKSAAGVRSRSISFTARNSNKVVEPATEKVKEQATALHGKLKCNLSALDKKILVWTKKYKSIEDIPERVASETMYSATNKFRIKVCNYMIVATIIGSILMIISGKRAAARGESVTKDNAEWHRKYNEEAATKEAAAKEKVQAK